MALVALSAMVGAMLPPFADRAVGRLTRDERYASSKLASLAAALVSATLAVLLLAIEGPTPKTVALMVFGWAMMLLFMTDAKSQLLPDAITKPLLLLGWLVQLWPVTRTVSIEASLLGAVMGYGLLQAVRLAYRRLRGHEGLGYGDVKLMAAVGAWLGPLGVTACMFLGSLLALAWQGVAALGDRNRLTRLFAFGPFLVAGALATLLLGVY